MFATAPAPEAPPKTLAELIERSTVGFANVALPPSLKLPALPVAVTRFTEQAGKPDANIKKLAAIVETDSGLTVELLRHLNAAFHGMRHKVQSVHQAITLLGLRQAKTFLVTTGVQAAVRGKKSKLINQGCFWNASLQKALFAREVAKMLGLDAESAFAGAMLQDYLLPVVTNDLYDTYLDFTARRSDLPAKMVQFEHDAFGWDHALAGASLARRWHLPDELVASILFHHRGVEVLTDPILKDSPAAAVALSALLPDQLRQDFRGLEQLAFLESNWPGFDLRVLCETVDAEHAELASGVRNDFPLTRRCKPVLEGQVLDPSASICDEGMLRTA
ncbi:MAG: HDOD domain-containing protein [Planctomycetota bacterium]